MSAISPAVLRRGALATAVVLLLGARFRLQRRRLRQQAATADGFDG